MAIIDETERKPNYYNDIHTFGKFAEQDFIDNFNKKNNQNAKLFDVRTIKVYQHYDIDFIIDKDGDETLPVLNNVLNNDRFQKIEVKYNSTVYRNYRLFEIESGEETLPPPEITAIDSILGRY